MNINVTFIIQIVNFWCAYFFLKKIFIRPMVSVVIQRKRAQKRLDDGLKKKEIFLKEKIELKGKALRDFQQYVKDRYKRPTAEYQKIPSEVTYIKDRDEIEKVVTVSKKLLIDRVPYVYR